MREERKKERRKKPSARMNWNSEEDAALLAFVSRCRRQWAGIKSEDVILEPLPTNVNRTRRLVHSLQLFHGTEEECRGRQCAVNRQVGQETACARVRA